MQSIQGQMQNVNGMPAQPGGAPPPAGSMPVNQGPGGQAMAPCARRRLQAPPVDQLYQSALRDYNSAKYSIAASEFGDVIHYYPQDALAGNAQFYLGEINYRQGKYPAAVKALRRGSGAVFRQFQGARRRIAQGAVVD